MLKNTDKVFDFTHVGGRIVTESYMIAIMKNYLSCIDDFISCASSGVFPKGYNVDDEFVRTCRTISVLRSFGLLDDREADKLFDMVTSAYLEGVEDE